MPLLTESTAAREKTDGWLLPSLTDEEWQSFKKVIGNPDWADNTGFDTAGSRVKNSDELDKRTEEWTEPDSGAGDGNITGAGSRGRSSL